MTIPRRRANSRMDLDALGPDVPLHFTAFHPASSYRTKRDSGRYSRSRRGRSRSMPACHYVYEGNIYRMERTRSARQCGELLVRRSGMTFWRTASKKGSCESVVSRSPVSGANDGRKKRRTHARRLHAMRNYGHFDCKSLLPSPVERVKSGPTRMP